MPNPPKSPAPITTVRILRDEHGKALPILLSRALWPWALHVGERVGERVMLETDTGDVMTSEVTLGPSDEPRILWPTEPTGTPRRVTVRRPRVDASCASGQGARS